MAEGGEKEWQPVIGIDLGTTNSCVAVWRNDRVEVIPNDQGNRTTPSCVAFNDTERLIGEAALIQATKNSKNTIFDAKRLIGRRFGDKELQHDIESWPFEVVERHGDVEYKRPVIKVMNKGEEKHLSPEEISSMILGKMKDIAEAYLGTPVNHAIITVPAYFNDAQRQATKDAGKIAGLNVENMINEPTAAAFAYGLNNSITGSEKCVLIFDLGGGTFDVSLISMKQNTFLIKSVSGDTHLGGVDFNSNMVRHFAEEFKKSHKIDITKDPKALGKLRVACESAKKVLSANEETTIEIDCLSNGIDFSSKITRAKFEKLNMDLFRKCIGPVEQCLKDANVDKKNVQEVVLVGGSTRIPKIQEMLQEFFNGKELCKGINQDEAVAYGAAFYAALKAGVADRKSIVLRDVAPLSLGIELYTGDLKVIVPRNTTIPTRKNGKVTTTFDNQTEASFNVYEGEMPIATNNNFLGKFNLSGIPPAPKGKPVFDVWFDIDANGILTASAEDTATGNKNQITITNQSRFTKEEIDRQVEEAKKYRADEQRSKRKLVAKNSLENYSNSMLERLRRDYEQMLAVEDMAQIKSKIQSTMDWLEWNDHLKEASLIEEKQKELQKFCDTILSNCPPKVAKSWAFWPNQGKSSKGTEDASFQNTGKQNQGRRQTRADNVSFETRGSSSSSQKSEMKTSNRNKQLLAEIERKMNEKNLKEAVEAREKLEDYAHDMWGRLNKSGERIGEKHKKTILTAIQETLKWLEGNSEQVLDVAKYDEKLKGLDSLCKPFFP